MSGGNGRRIVRLFRPYRLRLSWLLTMILFSAALGVVPPFLLRDLLNNVLSQGQSLDTERLAILVGGMVVIPIITQAIGVAQTWQSNLIGQQVMHDLRAAVYRHLQRLSLAFFTRTRTGEVQSRIANDIGGVQTVVTTTATSFVSNVTTVVTTSVAMVLLDWRLSIAAFALLPVFVLMTRRIGQKRRALTSTMQGTLADISTLVEESLSVSGVLLAKTMGQTDELTDRFVSESRLLADLEQRSRMAGRWVMGSIQATFAVMPALMYGVAGYLLSTGGPTDLDRHPGRVHDPADPALLPGLVAALGADRRAVVPRALRPRVRVPRPPGRHRRAARRRRARPPDVRGRVEFDDVSFGYDPDAAPILEGISFVAEPGSKVAVVGETGSGKTTLGYLVARLYDVGSGSVRIEGTDVRDLTFDSLRSIVGVVSQETYMFHGTVRENLAFARPGRERRGDRGRGPRRPDRRAPAVAAGGLRHRRRRARLPLLRRREAAAGDRPRRPA